MVSREKLRVAIIGSGLIGGKRAATVVNHPRTELAVVVDANEAAAKQLGEQYGVRYTSSWNKVLAEEEIDMVVVATPNGFLAEITIAALKSGRHVLVEKPMGRNVAEAVAMAGAATSAGKILKVGFNHRYHPALTRAHAYFSEGVIGDIINIRARYGHGGRPGYDKEWRGNRELAGGGELTDQGVHVLDLIHWFAGEPKEVFSFLQTSVWPIKPLEDGAFALMRFETGIVANFHTAWTQWKNMFSFEVFGTEGSITVDGLGRSYGTETLIVARRKKEGGRPYMETTEFDEEDISWAAEWADFVSAVDENQPYLGTPHDGVTAMNILDALYRSAEAKELITL